MARRPGLKWSRNVSLVLHPSSSSVEARRCYFFCRRCYFRFATVRTLLRRTVSSACVPFRAHSAVRKSDGAGGRYHGAAGIGIGVGRTTITTTACCRSSSNSNNNGKRYHRRTGGRNSGDSGSGVGGREGGGNGGWAGAMRTRSRGQGCPAGRLVHCSSTGCAYCR